MEQVGWAKEKWGKAGRREKREEGRKKAVYREERRMEGEMGKAGRREERGRGGGTEGWGKDWTEER